ncbi:MAG: hypothetical protein JSS97_20125, partial [Actinobacteria bacterium]|nr:hypothetical protein [Actinomycetota bacterium]
MPSTISENLTLTAAGSPYTGSSVSITAGATLKIEPGVVVRIVGAGSGITVNGTLDAEGTASEPVVFAGAEEKGPGEWASIIFQPG